MTSQSQRTIIRGRNSYHQVLCHGQWVTVHVHRTAEPVRKLPDGVQIVGKA